MKIKPYFIPAFLSVSIMAMATVASAQAMPEAMQQGNVRYITGGIGDGERDALESVKTDYNLHVLNAETTGAYVGETHLSVADHAGNEVLSSDVGPIFYAKLPAGKYTVTGTRHEETKKQSIHITSSGKPANVRFAWKTTSEEN